MAQPHVIKAMRPTEYRGLSLETKKFVFGNLIKTESGFCYILKPPSSIPFPQEEMIEVNSETVGMFTGLFDSTKWVDLTKDERNKWTLEGKTLSAWHGRKVFEWDVVSHTYKFGCGKGIVEYLENGFFLTDMCGFCSEEIRLSECRVIGNLHQSTELLGKGVSHEAN